MLACARLLPALRLRAGNASCLRPRCQSASPLVLSAPQPPSFLHNISICLVEPQGPANVGAVARLCQNFGLSDLRVVSPGTFVLDTGAQHHPQPFVAEALSYAVSARPLLEGCARYESAAAAVADATLVLATSARARDHSMRLLTPRQAAAEAAAVAAAGGRVAVLFGSERTGLANADLELAHALVAVPTASVLTEAGGNQGAGGRYSLNLSHAVSILAYELFQAVEAAHLPPLSSPLEEDEAMLDTGARARLVADLSAAVRSLEVLAPLDETPASPGAVEQAAHEAKALARAVSGAMMSKRGAKPLFALARRVLALQAMQPPGVMNVLDAPLMIAAANALEAAGVDAGAAVQSKAGTDVAVGVLKEALRGGNGMEGHLNLSRRELTRLVHALASKPQS